MAVVEAIHIKNDPLKTRPVSYSMKLEKSLFAMKDQIVLIQK